MKFSLRVRYRTYFFLRDLDSCDVSQILQQDLDLNEERLSEETILNLQMEQLVSGKELWIVHLT